MNKDKGKHDTENKDGSSDMQTQFHLHKNETVMYYKGIFFLN